MNQTENKTQIDKTTQIEVDQLDSHTKDLRIIKRKEIKRNTLQPNTLTCNKCDSSLSKDHLLKDMRKSRLNPIDNEKLNKNFIHSNNLNSDNSIDSEDINCSHKSLNRLIKNRRKSSICSKSSRSSNRNSMSRSNLFKRREQPMARTDSNGPTELDDLPDYLNNLVDKCKLMDKSKQKKLDYYYKPYCKLEGCQPLLPISFDNSIPASKFEDFNPENVYQTHAGAKWNNISKIILSDNNKFRREFIKSLNADVYSHLKDYASTIQKPKFQKILNFLLTNSEDKIEKLKFAKEGIETLNSLIDDIWKAKKEAQTGESQDEAQSMSPEDIHHTLINSLLMIKRDQLENFTTLNKKNASKTRYQSVGKHSRVTMTEFALSDRHLPEINNEKYFQASSAKCVPAFPLENSCFACYLRNSESRNRRKSKNYSYIRKHSENSTESTYISADESLKERRNHIKNDIFNKNLQPCNLPKYPTKCREDRNRSVPLVKILKPHSELKSLPSIDSVSSNGKSTFSKYSAKKEKIDKELPKYIDLHDDRFNPKYWKLTKH